MHSGLPQALCEYFDDADGVPGGMCDQCTFCRNGSGTEFNPTAQAIPDPMKIKAILDACPERDDPRLLARMAFGITSPRLTAGKWSTFHPLFGSMVEYDFNALVQAFDVECKKAGYQAVIVQPTYNTSTARKRSYAQSTSSYSRGGYYSTGSRGRGRGGGGRGSYSKRARW